MTVLLQIDASVRKERSISRGMGKAFREHWLSLNPADKVIHGDVGSTPPPFISEDWTSAAFTPANKRTDEQNSLLSLSDQLIEEVSAADIIIISSPMYNYGMPAPLKAWLDQIVRVNKTFTFDLNRGDFPLEPVMHGKSLVLLTAYGEFGFSKNGIREEMNHLGPHLKTVGKYLGADECFEAGVEYQEFDDIRHQHSLQEAHRKIPEIVETLSERLNDKKRAEND